MLLSAFLAGFIFAIALAVAGVGSRRRATWFAELLLRAAGPDELHFQVRKETGKIPEAKRQDTGKIAEVVQGLRSLGANAKAAQFAAGQATMHLGESAPLSELLKFGVQVLRRA